jgi:hypothetical protein
MLNMEGFGKFWWGFESVKKLLDLYFILDASWDSVTCITYPGGFRMCLTRNTRSGQGYEPSFRLQLCSVQGMKL